MRDIKIIAVSKIDNKEYEISSTDIQRIDRLIDEDVKADITVIGSRDKIESLYELKTIINNLLEIEEAFGEKIVDELLREYKLTDFIKYTSSSFEYIKEEKTIDFLIKYIRL